MKFNDAELQNFKNDLTVQLKALEKKYNIKIDLGKINAEEGFFSLKLNAVHAKPIVPSKPIIPSKPAAKPVAKPVAKPTKDVDDIDLESLDLESLDFSDLGADDYNKPSKPVVKPVAPSKPITPSKPVVKPAVKPVAKPSAKPTKDIDDIDLESLDLESLDFSDLGANDNKKSSSKNKDIDDIDLDSLDLDSLDFSDLGADEEIVPKKKKTSKADLDDDNKYSQELQKYLGNKYEDTDYDNEPDNIFDEKERGYGDDDISDEEIDAYLAKSNLYNFSFQAKLIQGEGSVQDFYTDIKNLLLSYSGVSSKVTWDYDTFIHKGKEVARINVDGDKLELYLRLDPEDYEDSSIVKCKDPKYSGTQLKYVISSISEEDLAYELIEDMSNENHIFPGSDKYDDYHFSYETNDELIARGLIKRK